MKKVMALLAVFILLTGCSGTKETQDKLLQMREELSQKECAFTAKIHGDFGENTYEFVLECQFDTAGNMTFTVSEPSTICGITGKISATGGSLTFDDKAVGFSPLADGEISPVSGPWLVMRALRSGFLSSWRDEGGATMVCIDDSFAGSTVGFQILLSKNLHLQSADILWEGKSILSISVENFRYL